MSGRKHREIPAALVRGRDRFRAWRRTRKQGARIPEQLWRLAAKLAVAHGVGRTASVLRLDYYALKKRVDLTKDLSASAAAAFIELAPRPVGNSGECVMEWTETPGTDRRSHHDAEDAGDCRSGYLPAGNTPASRGR